jgi:hypothetical protein
MRLIHKYPLDIRSKQDLQITGTKLIPLFVGLDPQGIPCLWIEKSDADLTYDYTIFIYGTGEGGIGDKTYIGSFIHEHYVWHVYHNWE